MQAMAAITHPVTRVALWLLILAGLCAGSPWMASVQAEAIYVDAASPPGGTGQVCRPYNALAVAISKARAGDIVLVKGGRYREAVVLEHDRVTLSGWGEKLPVWEAPQQTTPSLTIRADDCLVKRIHFTGRKGIVIDGAYNVIRSCVFSDCSEPVRAWGRCHSVIFCEVRNCQTDTGRGLFQVVGPNSYIGGNRFVTNRAPNAAAIWVRGPQVTVCDNVVFAPAQCPLRYGILSVSGAGDSQFDLCSGQVISYNRLYGQMQSAFIHIGGPNHTQSRVVHNTIVGAGGPACGIQLDTADNSVQITQNLIATDGPAITLAATSSGSQVSQLADLRTKNTFAGAQAKLVAGKGSDATETRVDGLTVEFQSTDPGSRAFLWPRAASKINRYDEPCNYAGARPAWPSPDPRNVAFGSSYLLSRIGRLWATDDSLPFCLTDGYCQRTTGARGVWRGRGFAGWHVNSADNKLYLWLDLGCRAHIDTVRLNMAHDHVARIIWPVSIDVSISDDDVAFQKVGTIVPDRTVSPRREFVEACRLQASGRYLLLTIHSDYAYTGLDEVQVFGSAQRLPVESEEAVKHPLPDEMLTISPLALRYSNLYRENKADLEEIVARAQQLGVEWLVRPHLAQATYAVRSQPTDQEQPAVERALHQVCAAISQAAFDGRDIVISPSTPYEEISSFALPCRDETQICAVTINACQDEREPGAFLLTNTSLRDLTVHLSLSPCRTASGKVFPGEQIVLRSPTDAVFRNKDNNSYVRYRSDPLVLLDHGEGNQLTLPSGYSRQIWISVDTTGVAAGDYFGTITVQAEGVQPREVSLRITVHPIKIPDQLELYSYVWSYWGGKRIKDIREEAVQDVIRHKVNTIIDHTITPWPAEGAFDSNGHLIKPINYANLDKDLQRLYQGKPIKFYVFYLLFRYKWARELLSGIPVGTERWKTALCEWLNDIAEHLDKQHGISTDNFAFYLYDELEATQLINIVEPAADALQSADPHRYPYASDIKLFVNFMQGTVRSSAFSYFEQRYGKIGIICPTLYEYPPQLLESLRSSGCQVWSYNGVWGWSRRSPHWAKLAGWLCFRDGFEGLGFWIYGSSRSGDPNDAVYTHSDNVPGAGDEHIIPSRRWEAWRDGQEDYHLLKLLERLAEDAQNLGHSSDAQRAMAVLHRAVNTVFAAPTEARRSLKARQRVIAEILRMRAITGNS